MPLAPASSLPARLALSPAHPVDLNNASQADLQLVVFSGGETGAEEDEIAALQSQAERFSKWLEAAAKARGAKAAVSPWAADATARQIPVRIAAFGPGDNQNDDALLARLGLERTGRIRLINGEGGPQAGLYAYEILNFVNGKRSVGEIRDCVSAEFGPIDITLVEDYLNALAEAKIVELKSSGQ